jgi:D-3-phosphoglycerate dehydrogenase
VFDNEPTPRQEILSHPKISLTPHIGAATNEAQERIGLELANLIIDHKQICCTARAYLLATLLRGA